MLQLRYSSLIDRHGHHDNAVLNWHLLRWHGIRFSDHVTNEH
jgi:hypothetical protein